MDEPDYGKRSRKTNSMINLYTGHQIFLAVFGQRERQKLKINTRINKNI